MRVVFLILLSMLLPSGAEAGAWPRAQGATFLSFGASISARRSNISADQQEYFTLFLERGLARDLTFGLDTGVDENGGYSAIVFLRAPVLETSEHNKFALQLGLGATTIGGIEDWVVQSAAAWGRGIDTPLGPGWAAADLQLQYLGRSQQLIAKLDVTLGVSRGDRWKFMLQLQAGDYPGGDPFVRLAPSAVWALRPGQHLEFGAQFGVVGDERIGAKIGTWMEF